MGKRIVSWRNGKRMPWRNQSEKEPQEVFWGGDYVE